MAEVARGTILIMGMSSLEQLTVWKPTSSAMRRTTCSCTGYV